MQHDPDSQFDNEGNFVKSDTETGLNCSTFVVTVFRSSGNPLVDTETWLIRESPERERDEAMQKRFVRELERNPEYKAQAKAITPEIGGPRVRPEEVAGACLEDELPAPYSRCRANGEYILGVIQAKK